MASDPYKYFRVEARELAEGLGQGALELEKGTRDPALVLRLLRLAHTLKGAARVVKQLEIAEASHQIEELLSPLREGDRGLEPEGARALFALIDRIEGLVEALDAPAPEPAAAPSEPARSAQAASLIHDSFRSIRVDADEMDALERSIGAAGIQVAALKRELQELRILTGLSSSLTHRLSVGRGSHARTDSPELNLALELQSGFERTLAALVDRAERVDQELTDVRDGAARLRLVPVDTAFATLGRVARDAADTLKKEVQFELSSGGLRLEARVLGPLRDAFHHLVRNAVAHGIETPDERLQRGKPRTGTVRIGVERRGSEVIFTCEDDGRGIDVEGVRRALMERGELTAAEGAIISREDLLRRLLLGGVSTSPEVTQLAGRGVGLNVLAEVSTKLRGQVSVESEPGQGTKVALRFSLLLASLRALLVLVGDQTVALPLETLLETKRIDPADLRRSVQGDRYRVGEELVPFLPLERALGRPEAQPGKIPSAVVVLSDLGQVVALGVDGLLGTMDIVLTPVPLRALVAPVVAHVSLDGEGNPRMVLDPGELVRAALEFAPGELPADAPRLPLLVIDDSLTTRMLEQSILESAGYEVELATSAEEGLEKARAKRYGVFLVDVEMPGMSGFEFVALTRQDPELKLVPAILVTSRNDPEDFEKGKNAGASDYIVKGDFDQKRLIATIERLLGR
ncbi:MAG: hypothetical protein B6A08_15750 [Sorangiineae bacterium NIC37A_2]|nr:MAG: hypothetical protein B6A08_15750 [Sorangiineae bacterium NIC37A_2]